MLYVYDATATSSIVTIPYDRNNVCTDVRNEEPVGTPVTCPLLGNLQICKPTNTDGTDWATQAGRWFV